MVTLGCDAILASDVGRLSTVVRAFCWYRFIYTMVRMVNVPYRCDYE